MAIIVGSSQNDTINGTIDNDTLDGGAGNDTINAGDGNDVLIYRYGQNIGANDIYNGDAGNDTLQLIFTQSELNQLAGLYSNGSVGAYTAALQSYASTHTSLGNYSLSNFGFNLTTSSIENLQIIALSSALPLVAEADSGFNVLQGSPLTINPGDLVANDSSVTGDNLGIIGIANATHGSLSIVNNQIVFTAAANYTGAASFTYTLNDQHGNIAIGTVSLNVSSNVTTQNEAGYNLFKNGTLAINAADLVLNDISATGDPLGIIGVGGATHGSFSIANNQIIFTGAANYTGVASFNYTVSDQHGNTATATVYLNVGDLIANNDSGYTVLQGNSLAINAGDLVLNDVSPTGDLLGIIGVSGATHGSFSIANGQIIFSAAANYTGAASFFYTLADQHGNVAIATVNLNVVADLGPHAADDTISNQSLGVNSFGLPFSGQFSLLNNDTGQGITLVPPSAPFLSSSGYATISWDSVNNLMIYTPHTVNDADYATNTLAQLALGDHGTDSFTYTIKDMNGNTSTATVHIDLIGINDVPFLDIDHNFIPDANPDQTIAYEVNNLPLGQTSVTITQAELIANFSDVDIIRSTGQHEPLTATINIANQTLPSSVNIHDNLDGTYTVSWDSNYNGGNIDISYAVNDPHTNIGNQVFGILDIVPNINPNHAPVAVDDINGSIPFNSPEYNSSLNLSAGSTGAILVLRNDSDPDGDPFNITNLSVAAINGVALSIAGDGQSINYNATNLFQSLGQGQSQVLDSFDYTITDSHGAQSTAHVTAVMFGVDDAPVVTNPLTYPGVNGTPYYANSVLSLTGNDLLNTASDVDANDHLTISSVAALSVDGATITLFSAPDPGGGANIITGVEYNPGTLFQSLAQGQLGTDSFEYVISDNFGKSVTGTVNVTITGVNDAPTANVDSAATIQTTPILINVLANDTDPDIGDTLTITSVGDPMSKSNLGASLTIVNNQINYNLSNIFIGEGTSVTDHFNYEIKDSNNAVSTSLVTVTVTGVGDGDGVIDSLDAAPHDPSVAAVVSYGKSVFNSDLTNVGNSRVAAFYNALDSTLSYYNINAPVTIDPTSNNILGNNGITQADLIQSKVINESQPNQIQIDTYDNNAHLINQAQLLAFISTPHVPYVTYSTSMIGSDVDEVTYQYTNGGFSIGTMIETHYLNQDILNNTFGHTIVPYEQFITNYTTNFDGSGLPVQDFTTYQDSNLNGVVDNREAITQIGQTHYFADYTLSSYVVDNAHHINLDINFFANSGNLDVAYNFQDNNADGVNDQFSHTDYVYGFGPNGPQSSTTYTDSNQDGVIDHVSQSQYSQGFGPGGLLNIVMVDNNYDGSNFHSDYYSSTASISTFIMGTQTLTSTQLSEYTTDTNGDGKVDNTDALTRFTTTSYTYNLDGTVAMTNTSVYNADTNGDGQITAADLASSAYKDVYTYNGDLTVATDTRSNLDVNDPNHVLSSSHTAYTYLNTLGHNILTLTAIDSDNNGTVDSTNLTANSYALPPGGGATTQEVAQTVNVNTADQNSMVTVTDVNIVGDPTLVHHLV